MNQTARRAESQVHSAILRLQEVALECGRVLRGVEVAYETYGQLNEEGTNAILVCHAFTGDARAYSEDGNGWWQGLVGPGSAFDTDRFFVVCVNVLGSCQGSTGPHSLDPETGKPYGSRFPIVTIRDMVNVQKVVLEHLGVSELHAVAGGSMGGFQALEWAVMYPDFVKRCIPMATALRASAMVIGYNDAMRGAIWQDPNWHGGDYYDQQPPLEGLALARKIGMITYRSHTEFEARFGHQTIEEQPELHATRFQIASYLDHAGEKLKKRFDANSYLTLCKAIDLHNLGRGRGSLEAALDRIACQVLWIGVDSDRLYPPCEQKAAVELLRARGKGARYEEIQSVCGHDAFLLAFDQLFGFVKSFINGE